MTRKEAERRARLAATLAALGFTAHEADQLRRISMTLRRWYELECGTEAGCIERDQETGRPYMVDHSAPPRFAVFCWADDRTKKVRATRRSFDNYRSAIAYAATVAPDREPAVIADAPPRYPVADRETGAQRRLNAIMEGKPLTYYLQTDPRGCALHILRPGDVPEGKSPASYYTNGIAIY